MTRCLGNTDLACCLGSPGHVDVSVSGSARHLAEGNPDAHGHHHREGDNPSNHISRAVTRGKRQRTRHVVIMLQEETTAGRSNDKSPAAMLLERLEVRVGLVAGRYSDRDLWVRPDGRLVVGAGLLVQSVPLVLAAKAVVAGAAAVDVAAPGAVERAVKVPHDVKVASVEQIRFVRSVRHPGNGIRGIGSFSFHRTWADM